MQQLLHGAGQEPDGPEQARAESPVPYARSPHHFLRSVVTSCRRRGVRRSWQEDQAARRLSRGGGKKTAVDGAAEGS